MEGGFFATQIYVPEAKTTSTPQVDMEELEKAAKNGGSRRPEAYTRDLRYIIP
jgi:hypothetical protein